MQKLMCAMGAVAVLGMAGTASAGFGGQTILGPLANGDTVSGNTAGASDDNDGFTSGDHIFFIWNGPDDAWQLDWEGGDLLIEMLYSPAAGADLDLFLYEPGSYDDSFSYSIINTGIETIFVPNAIAGVYYIVIDSEQGSNSYELSVIPAPGIGAAGLGMCTMVAARRRRG